MHSPTLLEVNMAEFCRNECGISGDCSGRINVDSVAQVTIARRPNIVKRLLSKHEDNYENWGTYSVVSDASGATSEVIPTGRRTAEQVVQAIGDCAGRGSGLCGAFPGLHHPYEDTPAARLIDGQSMQQQLAIPHPSYRRTPRKHRRVHEDYAPPQR